MKTYMHFCASFDRNSLPVYYGKGKNISNTSFIYMNHILFNNWRTVGLNLIKFCIGSPCSSAASLLPYLKDGTKIYH
jgi:hypothetical protein